MKITQKVITKIYMFDPLVICAKKKKMSENECFVSMDVNGIQVEFKIYTGSQANAITN